jgi:hypothetical protein
LAVPAAAQLHEGVCLRVFVRPCPSLSYPLPTRGSITGISMSPLEDKFISTSADGALAMWDLRMEKPLVRARGQGCLRVGTCGLRPLVCLLAPRGLVRDWMVVALVDGVWVCAQEYRRCPLARTACRVVSGSSCALPLPPHPHCCR